MWTKPIQLQSDKDIPAGNGYFNIQGKGICYNSYPVKNADPETFVWQLDFARDKNRCYRAGEAFREADPATFEVLNIYFARDKNHIYNVAGIDKKVDYETFTVLDTGFFVDEEGRKRKTTSFAKDKNGLWMMEYYSYKPVAIKGVDAESFERIDDSYARDKKYLLWRGKKVIKADPATFVALNANYGKDARNLIFQDTLFRQADYETFQVFKENITIAKDKNTYYHFDAEITEAEFKDLLQRQGAW